MLSICYLFFFLENIQIDLYYKTVHVHLSDFSSLICRKNNTGVSEGTQNENEMIVVTVFPLGTLLLSFPLKTALLPVQEFVVICQGSTPIILFLATTPTTSTLLYSRRFISGPSPKTWVISSIAIQQMNLNHPKTIWASYFKYTCKHFKGGKRQYRPRKRVVEESSQENSP